MEEESTKAFDNSTKSGVISERSSLIRDPSVVGDELQNSVFYFIHKSSDS